MKRPFAWILAAGLIGLTGLSCSDEMVRPAAPVLLLRVQDYDRNPGDLKVTNVELDRDVPSPATLIIASSLALYSTTDDGNLAGYVYELEAGASYSELRFTAAGSVVPVALSIDAAVAGMTYLAGLNF